MKRTAHGLLFCVLVVALDASAQTVDLADGTGRQIVNGSVAGGRAGTWLDVGDVSGDISNKDLTPGTDAPSGRLLAICSSELQGLSGRSVARSTLLAGLTVMRVASP